MFKFGTFLAHQSPDVGNAKKLISNVWHRSRDLLDSVVSGVRTKGRPRTFEVSGIKVDPRAICIASRPVLQAATKSNGLQTLLTAWENVITGYLSRNVSNGLASKASRTGIFQGFVFSAARSHVRYDGLAQKIVRFGFVGIGFAAGSQTSLFGNVETDKVYDEIRDMFARRDKGANTFEAGDDAVVVSVEDVEFGSVIGGGWNSAVFKARLQNLKDGGELNDSGVVPVDALDNVLLHEDQLVAVAAVTSEKLMEDIDEEMNFEEAINETKKTIVEQHEQLVEVRRIVQEQTAQLKTLMGEPTVSVFEDEISAVGPEEEETIEGFTLVLPDVMEFELEAFAVDMEELYDGEMSVRSSLASLTASFDELEAAVNFAEQQHDELVNLYQVVHSQKVMLQELIAQRGLDDGQPKTKMKAIAVSGTFYDHHQETDVSHFPVKKKDQSLQDLEISIDGTYTMAVKVRPMLNCSADYVKRMLIKELLPASSCAMKFGEHYDSGWNIPAHFNIVELYGGYVVPLADIEALSSVHMPSFNLQWPLTRSLQHGNALCVVTKRYEFTLAEFLASHSPGILESSLLLLQLIEAVVHLSTNGVCHRNINTNNIFVETTVNGHHLVISDFSQSICGDGLFGLHVPYITQETYKGGCLLAPEIINAETFSFLNYRKSDLWTVGAIAYEIFGMENPFRGASMPTAADYNDRDLPDLPAYVPQHLNRLVKSMLKRNPNERPDAVRVANALHILLWSPREWIGRLRRGGTMPRDVEIRRWLVQFAATSTLSSNSKETPITTTLQKMFLSRVNSRSMLDAVYLLWTG